MHLNFGCHANAKPLFRMSIIRKRANGTSIHYLYIFNIISPIIYLVEIFVEVFPPFFEAVTRKRALATFIYQFVNPSVHLFRFFFPCLPVVYNIYIRSRELSSS